MFCLLVLTFAYGALSAPTAPTTPTAQTTAPDMSIGLTQAFNRIDSDGSGTLDVSEFLKVFDKCDLNHDGKMTLAEYMSVNKVPKYTAQAVFKPLDPDHDGVLQRALVNNVIPAFDTDGDGAVSLAEFVTKYQQIFASLQNLPVGK